MHVSHRFLASLLGLLAASSLMADTPSKLLFDADHRPDAQRIRASDAEHRWVDDTLEVIARGGAQWPGIRLQAPSEPWDLTAFTHLEVALSNPGSSPVHVHCRVDNPGADGTRHCVTASTHVPPGQSATLVVPLQSTPWRLSPALDLIGMRGAPGTPHIDLDNVVALLLFLSSPPQTLTFHVHSITAGGRSRPLDSASFLPFIDALGQFAHADWPGKTHSEAELKAGRGTADLDAHPGPTERSAYGGWSAGPQREATGFFRVERIKDRWWLIDPDGYLFWSHGVDCVHSFAATPISDRETYFAFLPAEDAPLARFYGRGSWAPHGYYKDHLPYRTYDFYRANQFRIHGPDFLEAFNQLTHRRLRSWGLNTIGNWSDRDLCAMRRTPYTATIHFQAPVIEGSTGYWGKFFDVFDPAFAEACRNKVTQLTASSGDDPWCIGYFVHNELSWGDDLALARAALASPSGQPAKQAFIADLRKHYASIDALNRAWQTTHEDWQALDRCTDPPNADTAAGDLARFSDRIADTYFRVIDEELFRAAPDQLYLGCRFSESNPRAVRAAARYCDVISFNKYEYTVTDLRLPDGIDRPLMIGEFHFGALDRGMFHTGLRRTPSQQARADAYTTYVQSALRHPLIVGTHWFQYKDQATTGRGDGENYQIGFVDVCDRPYPEIVDAARTIGRTLYGYRLGN